MLDAIHNWPFAGAAIVSLLTAGVHVFIGGPEIARPLLTAEMRRVPKLTNYYCWHLVSITLLAMSAGFAVAAIMPGAAISAITWTAIAAAFAIWSLVLSTWKRISPLALPQWALFAPIAALGLWGLA